MAERTKLTSKARARVIIKAAMEVLNEAGMSLLQRDFKRAVAHQLALVEHDLGRC